MCVAHRAWEQLVSLTPVRIVVSNKHNVSITQDAMAGCKRYLGGRAGRDEGQAGTVLARKQKNKSGL